MLELIGTLSPETTLANSDFRNGFAHGIEAYEAEVEDKGTPILPTRAVLADIAHDVNFSCLESEATLDIVCGFTPTPPEYAIGFSAGWIAAHVDVVHKLFAMKTPPTIQHHA